MINKVQIAVVWVVLLVGLLFLPAWAFAAFSACVLLGLPTARWPRVYSLASRAIIAPVVAGIGFLSSWGVKLAIDSGWPLPLAQMVPSIGIVCEQVRLGFFEPLSINVSPACRLLLQDPHREYGFGLFLQILLLINLVCIRMWNLQPSLRESDMQAGRFAAVVLFVICVAALSFSTLLVDSELAALIEGPFIVPAAISYGGAVIFVLCISSLQVSLYPRRKRPSSL